MRHLKKSIHGDMVRYFCLFCIFSKDNVSESKAPDESAYQKDSYQSRSFQIY